MEPYEQRIATTHCLLLLCAGATALLAWVNKPCSMPRGTGSGPLRLSVASASVSASSASRNHRLLLETRNDFNLLFDEKADVSPAFYAGGDDRLVYCPVQKVASGGWRRFLSWLGGDPDWDTQYSRNVLKLTSYSAAKEALFSSDWTRFIVVRDPAERLLAVFREKCFGVNLHSGSRFASPGPGKTCNWRTSFVPFLQWLEARRRDPDNVGPWDAAAAVAAILSGAAPRAIADKGEGAWAGSGLPQSPEEAEDWQTLKRVLDADEEAMFPLFALAKLADVERVGCETNDHFRSQHCFCGIHKYLKMGLWHVVSFRDMAAAADTVFGDAYRHPNAKRKEEIRAFVREHFSSNTEAANKKTNTDEELVAKFYTPALLQRTRDVYGTDYELLGNLF